MKLSDSAVNQLIQQIKQNIAGSSNKSLYDLLTYQQGEAAQVTEGPFKGLEAIYKIKSGLERSDLTILGYKIKVGKYGDSLMKIV